MDFTAGGGLGGELERGGAARRRRPDGVATTTVTVTAEDANGNLVAGDAAVTLSATRRRQHVRRRPPARPMPPGVFTRHVDFDRGAGPRRSRRAKAGVHRDHDGGLHGRAVSAAKSSVVASPATVAADGVATTTLTVTVEDANGNLVAGNAAVTLSASGGAGNTFDADHRHDQCRWACSQRHADFDRGAATETDHRERRRRSRNHDRGLHGRGGLGGEIERGGEPDARWPPTAWRRRR